MGTQRRGLGVYTGSQTLPAELLQTPNYCEPINGKPLGNPTLHAPLTRHLLKWAPPRQRQGPSVISCF